MTRKPKSGPRTLVLTAKLLVFAFALAALAGLSACDNGVDREQAETYCHSNSQSNSTCFDQAAFESCVSCYEDCGVDCQQSGTCPLQFSCD